MGRAFECMGVDAGLDDLLAACERLGITVARDESFDTFSEMIDELCWLDNHKEVLGAKEHQGRTYIYGDISAFCHSADLAVKLSRELACKVVVGSAYSTSGCYFLCYAQNGRLIRLYCVAYISSDKTVEMGAPLPCEGLIPLDRSDCEGIILALTSLGYDVDRIPELEGPFETLLCTSAIKFTDGLDQKLEEEFPL